MYPSKDTYFEVPVGLGVVIQLHYLIIMKKYGNERHDKCLIKLCKLIPLDVTTGKSKYEDNV